MFRTAATALLFGFGLAAVVATDPPKKTPDAKTPPPKDKAKEPPAKDKDAKAAPKAAPKKDGKGDKAAKTPPKTDPAEAAALEKVLRGLLAANVPDPLTKWNKNWGNQKAVTVVRRHREGLRIWTEPVQELRNDGTWRRADVRIPDPKKVNVSVTELTHPAEGKMLATVVVTCERADLKFEQQVWRTGLRLYGGETRAHCKSTLQIKVEVTTKTEFKKGALLPIPEVTLKVRATEAQLSYDDLEVDHTAGLGGDAAEIIGDVVIGAVKLAKPDLEADLLAKANAAIVKAAGTREFKLAMDSLLKLKK